MAVKSPKHELEKRIRHLEERRTAGTCSGWVIYADREAFPNERDFQAAVEEAIATHREKCGVAEHGFVVRPPIAESESFDAWAARYKPR